MHLRKQVLDSMFDINLSTQWDNYINLGLKSGLYLTSSHTVN